MPQNSAAATDRDRLDRIQAGMEATRSDWRAYFAILAAASNQRARITQTIDHFRVEEDVATIALDQPVSWFVGQMNEEERPSR